MEISYTEVSQIIPDNDGPKVHRFMCNELMKVLDRVVSVHPMIESFRPGCKEGIQELCSLSNTVEKGKLIIRHCAECSKFYLAVTGETILSRCERIRGSLNRSLTIIQTMVPPPLATQILELLDYIRDVKFLLDSVEEEAGKSILELLRQSNVMEDVEFKIFQLAATKLQLNSPKAMLIERRSINKLLEKTRSVDPKKEVVLKFFLYLFKKYGKTIKLKADDPKQETFHDDKSCSGLPSPSDSSCGKAARANVMQHDWTYAARETAPPEEYYCPLSGLIMHDPVIIASGRTFERKSIERWFRDGNVTCPRTQMKLENFSIIPNTSLKDLISNWHRKSSIRLPDPAQLYEDAYLNFSETSGSHSISSLANVLTPLIDGRVGDYAYQNDHSTVSIASSEASCTCDTPAKRNANDTINSFSTVLPWSTDYQKYHSFCNFNYDMYLNLFRELSGLQLEIQVNSAEELAIVLEADDSSCHAMMSNGFAEASVDFLMSSFERQSVQACRVGAQFFLAFLKHARFDIPALNKDSFCFVASLVDSELRTEALLILHELVLHQKCNFSVLASVAAPSVMKLLETDDLDCIPPALKIICELSSDSRVKRLLLSFNFISRLVQLLGYEENSSCCLKVLRNLVDAELAVAIIVSINGCIASVAEYLDSEHHEEKEHAVNILHAICTHSLDNCSLVMKEGVIPSLVDLSVNGGAESKEKAITLLQLLRNHRFSETAKLDIVTKSPEALVEKWQISKSITTKSSRFSMGRIRTLFRLRSVAHS